MRRILVVKERVIVGISGGEYGIREFLDAYDAETGKRNWRFWTVPGPGEAGHETWDRRKLEDRLGTHIGGRFVRSGSEPSVLGNGESGSELQWRAARGRQSLCQFAPGDQPAPRAATSACFCSLRQASSQSSSFLDGYTMRPPRFTNRGPPPSLRHLTKVFFVIPNLTDTSVGVRYVNCWFRQTRLNSPVILRYS